MSPVMPPRQSYFARSSPSPRPSRQPSRPVIRRSIGRASPGVEPAAGPGLNFWVENLSRGRLVDRAARLAPIIQAKALEYIRETRGDEMTEENVTQDDIEYVLKELLGYVPERERDLFENELRLEGVWFPPLETRARKARAAGQAFPTWQEPAGGFKPTQAYQDIMAGRSAPGNQPAQKRPTQVKPTATTPGPIFQAEENPIATIYQRGKQLGNQIYRYMTALGGRS